MNTQRVFNAIDGAELTKIILKDIEKELSTDSDFRQHRAYPMVKYSFELKLEVSPAPGEGQTVERKIEGQVVQHDKEKKTDFKPKPGEKPLVISVRRGKEIRTPDQARADAGLPITVPTKTAVGTVDKAEDRTGRGATIKNRASTGFGG
jgi:hypothetical protein